MFLHSSSLLHLFSLRCLLQQLADALSPSFNVTQTSSINPSNQTIDIRITVDLDHSESLDTVKWYKDSVTTEPIAVHSWFDGAEKQKGSGKFKTELILHYGSDIFAEEVTLALVILPTRDEKITPADEGIYIAVSHIATPSGTVKINQYTVYLTINVATMITMEVSVTCRIGELCHVSCYARGWKPAAHFRPLVFRGENYKSPYIESELEQKILTKENHHSGSHDVTATYNFKMENKHRGILITCSASNDATEGHTINITKVLHESIDRRTSYQPVEGDSCLWPSNTVSQCSSEEEPGQVCQSDGMCRILVSRACETDQQCGDITTSNLQCIEGHCICNDKIHSTLMYEPFCKLRLGSSCSGNSDCISGDTVCVNKTCQCDVMVSKRVTTTSRGHSYPSCQQHVGSSDCTTPGLQQLVCDSVSKTCRCASTAVEYEGRCLSETQDSAEKLSDSGPTPKKLSSWRQSLYIIGAAFGALFVGLMVIFTIGHQRRHVARRSEDIRRHQNVQFAKSETNIKDLPVIELRELRDAASERKPTENPAKRRNPKIKSEPKRRNSASSVTSYSSVGKKKRDGPDFGESSTDELAKYIAQTVRANRKKKGQKGTPLNKQTKQKKKKQLEDFIPNLKEPKTENTSPTTTQPKTENISPTVKPAKTQNISRIVKQLKN